MKKEIYLYIFFTILIIALLVIICMILLCNREYSTKFYNYKIRYDANLDKYYSMLKKQKRIILKYKLKLLYLKILVKIKCW